MRTDDVGSPISGPVRLSESPGTAPAAQMDAQIALAESPHPDALSTLDALAMLRAKIHALEALERDTFWRARAEGLSWYTISAASGIGRSTVRRWAAREDDPTRRRRDGAA